MREYKILWKMKGADSYFSTRTLPGQCVTHILDERGRIITAIGYGSSKISRERLFRQIARYSETSPESFFGQAGKRGAQIIVGDADLRMNEEEAVTLQTAYSGYVKLVPYAKTRPAEVKIKLEELESEYEEA